MRTRSLEVAVKGQEIGRAVVGLGIIAAIGGAIWYAYTAHDRAPRALTRPGDREYLDGLVIDQGEARVAVRRAVSDYVRATYPDARIIGISTVWIAEQVFAATVDIQRPAAGVLELIVRRFYPTQGAPYWAAYPMTDAFARSLSGAAWRELHDLRATGAPPASHDN
jgi:hypothetical protein